MAKRDGYKEAERRIEEARKTGATELDLSDLELTELPDTIGNLTQLTRLDLENNQLTEIPKGLGNLTQLTELYLYVNQLTEIPESLGNLTQLTELYLSDNQLTEIPESLGNLTQLTELYLSDNQLTEIPESLGNLTQLTELYLSDNQLTEIPEVLGNLTQLTVLDLSNNQFTEIPESLGNLTQLTKLYLRNNQFTEIPESLGNLTQLTGLYLSDNELTEIPEGLGNLTQLTELDLHENQLTEIPESLENLTQLTTLYLSNNQLTEIPEVLGNLTQLTKLYLRNNQLTEIPEVRGNLTQLTKLDLTYNQLTEIPESLENLTQLTTLYLAGNQLTEIPEVLGNLTQLTTLHLAGNQLTEIPEVLGNLTQLTELDLHENQLTEIPESLENLTQLTTLYLSNNQLTEIPEVLGNLTQLEEIGLDNNPLNPELAAAYAKGTESVKAYLRELAKGSQKRYEAKLLILGDGNEGKTCVSRALRGLPFEKQVTTRGVDVEQWTFPHPDDPGDAKKKITLNIWDFEGQEINHQTHQFFLTDDSLYLLVFKCRDQFLLDRAEYWLDTIKARAPKARVTIVITECEERTPLIPEDRLISEYENVLTEDQWLFPVGCAKDLGIPELRDFLVCRAANLKHIGRVWPNSYRNVETNIEEQTNAGNNYINRKQLYAIFGDAGIEEGGFNEAANAMASLGIITQFTDCPDLENFIVLEPQWLTKAISEIMEDKQLKTDMGKISQERMAAIWGNKYIGMFPTFHNCMKEFELCYDLDYYSRDCLIPLRFSFIKPDIPWSNIENIKERRVTYKLQIHPPLGLMARFIVKTHHMIAQTPENPNGVFWHNGVFLRKDEGAFTSEALCEFDDLERTLSIKVRAAFPQTMIEQLHNYVEAVFSFYKGIKAEKSYGCISFGEQPEHETSCDGMHTERRICFALAKGKPIDCEHGFHEVDPMKLIHGVTSFGNTLLKIIEEERDPIQKQIAEILMTVKYIGFQQNINAEVITSKLDQTQSDVNRITPEMKQIFENELHEHLGRIDELLDDRDFTAAPGIIMISPVDRSPWNPKKYIENKYILTPFCEYEQNIHPCRDACVEFTKDKEWWTKTAPWIARGVGVLSVGVQIAVTGMPLMMDDDSYNLIKNDAAFMKELAKHLKLSAHDEENVETESVFKWSFFKLAATTKDRYEDRAMRTSLARLLEELAPTNYKAKQWGSLRRVKMPDNSHRWLCKECDEKRRKGLQPKQSNDMCNRESSSGPAGS